MKLNYYRAIFLHLSIVFALLFSFTINAQIIQIGQDIDGEAANDYSGTSVSMNAAGDKVAIGADYNDGNGYSAGHVRIYAWNGTHGHNKAKILMEKQLMIILDVQFL